MSIAAIPKGNNQVSPYLVVENAKVMLEFVKKAFGAQEKEVFTMPDGTVMHCEVKIGDSVIMIGTTSPETEPMKSMIHIYTEDCDAMYQQALEAGAVSVRELEDQFYGDRSGGVADPYGNFWWIATHIEDVSPEEMNKRVAAFKGDE